MVKLQRRWTQPQQEGQEHLCPVPGETRGQDSQGDEGVCREASLHAGYILKISCRVSFMSIAYVLSYYVTMVCLYVRPSLYLKDNSLAV